MHNTLMAKFDLRREVTNTRMCVRVIEHDNVLSDIKKNVRREPV